MTAGELIVAARASFMRGRRTILLPFDLTLKTDQLIVAAGPNGADAWAVSLLNLGLAGFETRRKQELSADIWPGSCAN